TDQWRHRFIRKQAILRTVHSLIGHTTLESTVRYPWHHGRRRACHIRPGQAVSGDVARPGDGRAAPPQEPAVQVKNAGTQAAPWLGVEVLASLASGVDERRLAHRNPDLRVTPIDQRRALSPAIRGSEIERQDPVEARCGAVTVGRTYL